MLDDLFLSVLNMSLFASYVIVFVLLARFFLKKAPKIFSYALWSVVLLRLLCPLSFESALSLIPIDKQPISQDIIYSQTPQISTGMTVVDNMINPILPAPTDIGASINPIQVWLFIGEIIWISGIVAMAIYSIISFIKLKRSLITSTPLKENIYLADHISTPFVLGVKKPKIYLPSSLFESEQNYIIRHELCHIKRLDHITRILGFIALSVHWFNPLVWIAFALSGKDMELSCDEAVMKSIGSDIKAEYSQSLLRFGTPKKMLHATPLAFGEGDTKSRVKNVLNYKKPAFWVVIVAAVSCAVMIICFSSNPIRLPFDFSTNAVVSASSLDKRGSDNPAAVELTKEQIQELMRRIDNISSVKQSDEYGGFTPLYSVSAQLADNTHFFVNGYAYDSDKIDIVYQDKAYKIKDAQFSDYFSNVFEAKELWAMRPMVMINGILYLDTGKEGPMGDSNAVSGTIKSAVSGDKKPTEHEQSNFGFVGSKYADGGDFIQVNIDDKWIVFEREKPLILTKETAGKFINQALSTFKLNSDNTVSFTLPVAIPTDESGKTKLYISSSATFVPEPSTSSVQEILDWNVSAKNGITYDWQGGESYIEALDLSKGKLTRLFLRVAFMTTVSENSYQEYAANYIELIEPFTYDTPVSITDRSVEIKQVGASSVLKYTMQNGENFSVTLSLPSGIALSTSEDYPKYASKSENQMPTVAAVKGGIPIGTLSLHSFGTDDKDVLMQVDTTENTIPMQLFAGIALSNHAMYDNYKVIKSSATGANAVADYLWQDLTNYSGRAPEAPWLKSNCILAYDYEKTPFLINLNITDGSLSFTELENLAKSIVIMNW